MCLGRSASNESSSHSRQSLLILPSANHLFSFFLYSFVCLGRNASNESSSHSRQSDYSRNGGGGGGGGGYVRDYDRSRRSDRDDEDSMVQTKQPVYLPLHAT